MSKELRKGVKPNEKSSSKTFIRLQDNQIMRFLVRAQISTEAGDKMVKNPKFLQNLENYIKKVNAEAAYFFEAGGDRTFVFIVKLKSSDIIPSVAEPLFQDFGAKVELHPVMVLENIKKAVEHMR